MAAYGAGGENGSVLSQWPQEMKDLSYHKFCPLSLLLKNVPNVDDILELYYHCKLCSAPQAYLEQQAFLTHIQEFHADYYQPEQEEPVLVFSYPESKSTSSQATSDEFRGAAIKPKIEPGEISGDNMTEAEPITEENVMFPNVYAKQEAEETEPGQMMNEDRETARLAADTPDIPETTLPATTPVPDTPNSDHEHQTSRDEEIEADRAIHISISETPISGQIAPMEETETPQIVLTQEHISESPMAVEVNVGEMPVAKASSASVNIQAPLQEYETLQAIESIKQEDTPKSVLQPQQLRSRYIIKGVMERLKQKRVDSPSTATPNAIETKTEPSEMEQNTSTANQINLTSLPEQQNTEDSPKSVLQPQYFTTRYTSKGVARFKKRVDSASATSQNAILVDAKIEPFQLVQNTSTENQLKPASSPEQQNTEDSPKSVLQPQQFTTRYIGKGVARIKMKVDSPSSASQNAIEIKTEPSEMEQNTSTENQINTASLPEQQNTAQDETMALYYKDLKAIEDFEASQSSQELSNSQAMSSQEHSSSQEEPYYEMDMFYDEDEEKAKLGFPRCEVCARRYKPWHAKTCKRPHKSEKPSCDAYVCVKEKSEPVYPCPFCPGRFFLDKHGVRMHVIEHQEELEGQMRCDVCGREFKHVSALVAHMSQCDYGQTAECPECNKVFTSRKAMEKHAENIHYNAAAHICETCGKTFNCRGNLMNHMRIHTGEKPFKCQYCELRFRNKPNLVRHQFKHTGERPHTCPHCSRGYADKSTLDRHIAMVHSQARIAKRRTCRHCQKELKSERQLIKHIQAEHADVEPNAGYTCDICNKLFRDKHNMESHRMVHTGERPFPCPKCGKTFRKNADLTIHYRIHTGEKPYKCDICGAGFTTNSNLSKHRMSHTGERPHKCQLCNRCFVDKSHLNRHMLTHTGEKPHPCAVCERGFATKSQLQQHMLIHTGEKPFICGACGKAFRQKAKAQRHRCLWKVIQKPGQQYQYATMDDDSGEVLQINEGGSNQIAVRVIDPEQGTDQVSYQFIEEGGGEEQVYQIIEGGASEGEQIMRVMHSNGTVVGEADGQQIAYQIVDESGATVSDDQIAVRVINQLASSGDLRGGKIITAGGGQVLTAGAGQQVIMAGGGQQVVTREGGEQVALQVVDGEHVAIQYQQDQAITSAS